MFPIGNQISAIIGIASNVRGGENPPFTISDFEAMYPQFFTSADDSESDASSDATTPLIPENMLQTFVDLAHACVKKSRFKEAWEFCMGLFIAHFATLYAQTMTDPTSEAAILGKAGMAGGLMSSKAVDSVSISYDYSAITNDLEGWAGWKLTAYGVQLATFAKMFAMAGMYVR